MKRLILSLFTVFISLFSMAQNGGQYSENSSLRLEFAGNISGVNYAKVTNKTDQSCYFRVNNSKTEASILIAASSSYTFALPVGDLANMRIKAKPDDNCNCTDKGWIELVLQALPLTFVSFNTERISNTEFWVNFEIADAKNVKQFNIQASTDGVNYKTITVLFPDELQPNRKYKVKINLTNISK